MIVNAIRSFFGFPQANAPPSVIGSQETAEILNHVANATQYEGNTMNTNIANLLSAVWTAIKVVESAASVVSTKPSSVEKADSAIAVIDSIIGGAKEAAPSLMPVLAGLVSLANLFGIFKKTAA